MKTCLRLWNEESGAILSAEIMLVASCLVIGVLAGLTSLRDSIVTELADVAQAFANVNQSYSFSGTQGHHVFTGGGFFADYSDFCDTANLAAYQSSKCVLICVTPVAPIGTDGTSPQ